MKPIKLYQVVLTFSEPTQAAVTLKANSQEDAIDRITEELSGQVEDLYIESITELCDLPDEIEATVASSDAPVPAGGNVVMFPGTKTLN